MGAETAKVVTCIGAPAHGCRCIRPATRAPLSRELETALGLRMSQPFRARYRAGSCVVLEQDTEHGPSSSCTDATQWLGGSSRCARAALGLHSNQMWLRMVFARRTLNFAQFDPLLVPNGRTVAFDCLGGAISTASVLGRAVIGANATLTLSNCIVTTFESVEAAESAPAGAAGARALFSSGPNAAVELLNSNVLMPCAVCTPSLWPAASLLRTIGRLLEVEYLLRARTLSQADAQRVCVTWRFVECRLSKSPLQPSVTSPPESWMPFDPSPIQTQHNLRTFP
jgi:hypothetical protein